MNQNQLRCYSKTIRLVQFIQHYQSVQKNNNGLFIKSVLYKTERKKSD